MSIDTSHPPHGPRIAGQLRIAGEQRDPLDERLSDEQSVEGILVQGRQGVDAHRMLAVDSELGVAVVEQASAQ